MAAIQVIFNKKAPDHDQRLDLAIIDFYDALVLFVDIFNPLWMFRHIFRSIFGYDPEYIIIED